jgi:hypothetical protein
MKTPVPAKIGVDAPPTPAAPGRPPVKGPPPLRGPRPVAIGPMRDRATSGLRKLAGQMKDSLPEMDVHQHLQDAARELDSGRTHNAQRHVNAAIFHLTPLQLRRHGVTDDAGHMRGKAFMQQAHRHLLLIKDIEDVKGSNDDNTQQRRDAVANAATERAARIAPPPAPPQAQPVAASWERHLHVIELVAQHESASGRRALRAKGQTAYGTSFPVPNIAYLKKAIHSIGRAPASKRGKLKAFLKRRAAAFGRPALTANLTAEELAAIELTSEYLIAIELVGPKGWSHGWIRALGAGSATEAAAGGTGFSAEPSSAYEKKMRKQAADVATLSHEQRSEYNRHVINGESHDASLKAAKAARTHNPLVRGLRAMGRSLEVGAAGMDTVGFTWEDHLAVIELVGPKGYIHGWIKVDPTKFAAGLKPGSFEHLRAIEDLGSKAVSSDLAPGSRSPTMQTALHNLAQSVAGRDMAGARAHLASAKWANKAEAHGLWNDDLAELEKQLDRVPKAATGWQERRYNPLSRTAQPKGRGYVGTALPANPTAGAMAVGYSWEQHLHAIELSANTARLSVMPAPRGKPGGPGLYDIKGMGHTPYLQNIVKALIEKRHMPPGKAYAIARGAIRRWAGGGGHVHAEVRAAAGKAEAGELAKQARARAKAA